MSRLRNAMTGLAVGTALAVTPAGLASGAPAEPELTGGTQEVAAPAAVPVQTLQNLATKRYLDDSGKGLRTLPRNGRITQKWRVRVIGSTRRLQSVGTGECLDDSRKGLRTIPCWGDKNPNRKFQRWFKVNYSNGTIRLQNQVTRECLDDSGKGLRTIKCWPNSNPNRKFQGWR